MSRAQKPRAWVGVVSQSHVLRGVAGGFAQLNHGKRAPLEKMGVGDWLVYYSPSTDFPEGEPLRAFTALGKVVGAQSFLFDMGDGFVPHRRAVDYRSVKAPVEIRGLSAKLAFVRDNPNWGMLARRGHFEISLEDLAVIARALGVRLDR